MITNSAGLSGAKPTTMLTMPRLMSFCVVVSASHLTKYASRGVCPLECALAEEIVHERTDVEANLRPERLVVRLEDHPLQTAEEALLDEERRAAHGDVLVFIRRRIVAAQRACAPHDVAEDREGTKAIDAAAG